MKVVRYSFLVLSIIICAFNATAQETSICGRIETGQLSIPSYKFVVVDEEGRSAQNFIAVGKLQVAEGVWRGTWIEGHWADKYHDINITVVFDAKTRMFISQEVPKVTIHRRRKGLFSGSAKCLDRVTRLEFSFRDKVVSEGSFVFHFPNKLISEVSLPDHRSPINVTVRK